MPHPLAGKQPPKEMLSDIPALISNFYAIHPDPTIKSQRVAFGTSGHRGSANRSSFNEDHLLAITQAVCEYRHAHGYKGPLFMGRDSHALSTPAQMTALRVCVANGVKVCIAEKNGLTPTPLVSFAILEHNRTHTSIADGIVITPSHNPPEDGGFKYNPPNGGPADTNITRIIEARANEILEDGLREVKALSYEEAMASSFVQQYDFITPYVRALGQIINMEAIKASGLRLAADALGGSALGVYHKINEIYDLQMDLIEPYFDPTFSFMPLDHDGKIRMDCSSPYAMASLVDLKDRYDLAFGNDTDADRHGIVTPSGGLMNPNHYLSVAISYLFSHRPKWSPGLKIGKTLVSSSMIDRVAKELGKEVYEVPVGFKWFVEGLHEGWLGFGGEESAGASFLRRDGTPWSTDKDGIIMTMLAAEIMAVTGNDPAQIYAQLEAKHGQSYYARIDAPANDAQKERLKHLTPDMIDTQLLGDEKITAIYTQAPGNGAAIGGVKIITPKGWVALRPSGTEAIYKIYAESFVDPAHLSQMQTEAQAIVSHLL